METSQSGIALIKAFESCLKPTEDGRIKTYRDIKGVLTIGWGTTRDDVPDLKDGDIWTRQQCDEIFAKSLKNYEEIVNRRTADRKTPLNQLQFDALVSFVYNVGEDGLFLNGRLSKVGQAIIDGNDSAVPDLLLQWNHCDGKEISGLTRRRKAEGALYSGNLKLASQYAEEHIPGSTTTEVDVPKGFSASQTKTSINPATAAIGATVVAATATHSPAITWGWETYTFIAIGLIIVIGAISFKRG